MSSLFGTPQQQETPGDLERYRLEEGRKSGAHWFYWIAALSLVTSFISLAGGQWGFFISLGVTQLMDGIVAGVVEAGVNPVIKAVAVVFDVLAAGAFALLGYLAARGHGWAFIVGMMAYALDALIFVMVGHWFGLAFHAFALYSIFGGYRASAQLRALEAQRAVAHAAPAGESVVG